MGYSWNLITGLDWDPSIFMYIVPTFLYITLLMLSWWEEKYDE